MKRIFTVVLVMILALTGCSSPDTYAKGTLTDTTFESEYLNIKFELPEGYIMRTEDELIAANEDLKGVNKKDIDYKNLGNVFELIVTSPANDINLSIMLEKMPNPLITTATYAERIGELLNESIGESNYTLGDTYKQTMFGDEYLAVPATISYSGISVYQTYYLCVKQKRAQIILLTSSENKKEDAKKLFDALKPNSGN